MAWLSTLKDLWWLAGLVVLLLGFIWRTAIKTNKLLGQVEAVKQHEAQIKDIKEDIEGLSSGVEELKGALTTHVVDQKGDIQAINKGLLAIMEQLIHPKDSMQKLEEARDALQNRLIEK